MTWTYKQLTGELYWGKSLVGKGYSGHGDGRNNPSCEDMPNYGPIPRGRYTIGAPRFSSKTGRFVMDLEPVGHDACGRTAFQIHGDNKTNDASHGCIIMSYPVRTKIAASKDSDLEVV